MAVLNSEKAHAGDHTVDQAAEPPRSRPRRYPDAEPGRGRRGPADALQDQADLKQEAKNAALRATRHCRRPTRTRGEERASRDAERKKLEGTPKEVAMNLLPDHGWSESQFSCLEKLWNKESRWKVSADNPSSSGVRHPAGAPGNRMAAYGSDWRTNPVTQIKWGLDYIENTYGSPCGAWGHSKDKGWY